MHKKFSSRALPVLIATFYFVINVNAQVNNKDVAPLILVNNWVNTPQAPDITAGDYIFFYYWNIWLEPAYQILPVLDELAVTTDGMVFIAMFQSMSEADNRAAAKLGRQCLIATDYQGITKGLFDIDDTYRTAFLIAPDGKVIWKGGSEQITRQELAEIMNTRRGEETANQRVVTVSTDNSFIPLSVEYSSVLSIREISKKNKVESHSFSNDFNYHVFVGKLGDIVPTLLGISPHQFDSGALWGNPMLKIEVKGFPYNPNLILNNLQEIYSFHIEEETIIKEVWSIEILEEEKLKPKLSAGKHLRVDPDTNIWIGEGATLEDLAYFLEKQMNERVVVDSPVQGAYNWEMKSGEPSDYYQKTLSGEYGVLLKRSTIPIQMKIARPKP